MIRIIYIEANGQKHQLEAEPGSSAMSVAMVNNLPGIDAECGGQCVCGTCHVFIDEEWMNKLPPADPVESEMLDFSPMKKSNSRLACQVKINKALDGLIIRLPSGQQ